MIRDNKAKTAADIKLISSTHMYVTVSELEI